MGFFDDLTKSIRNSLKGDIDDLLKADADALPDTGNLEDKKDGKGIGQKAIIDDPFFDQVHQHFIFKNKMSRISNKTLKDTSLRDWLVSSIIQTRADTMLMFARPQRKQFDTGFRIKKKDGDENLTAAEKKEIANLEDFILNCGRKKGTPAGEEMLFGEFLKLLTRDALTFGHIAIEKILTRGGGLHRVRPLPSESMYLINKKTSRDIIEKEIKNARKMVRDAKEFNRDYDPAKGNEINEPDIDYYKYVQMSYDNRVLSAFGDEDMIWKLSNPQNFADSMGYCYSTLELAVINVTSHLNVENYNANFFTHGYAARGILHLKGTVTQAQMTAFRRQFYNTISGSQNAWRTPIIAGLDDVQWVSLSGSAKEMEYLNYNNHLMRALCTQFQIDPVELGLDFLTSPSGRSPMQQANNEYKITYSRERGLLPVLMMFEDMINCDVLPAIDRDLADKYEFKFVGYTDETPQTNVSLLQAEMTVHSTMNDLLRASEKEAVKHPIFDLPLNQTFWELVDKMMTKGEQREFFLGDKSAKGKRELAYFPGDPAFMGWQQMLMTLDRSRQQDKMQAQQMQAEQAQAEQQGSREQQAHDAEMDERAARQAHAAAAHETLKESAKESGAATEALHVGGKTMGNPLNSDEADE
jgi:hypothetical protein